MQGALAHHYPKMVRKRTLHSDSAGSARKEYAMVVSIRTLHLPNPACD